MKPFTLSLFDSVGDTRPKQVERTWAQLCAKFAKPAVRQEKDGLLFSPARYRAPRRLIANVIELSLLVLEVDGAWKCEGTGLLGACGHKGPLVMFRNARRGKDHCPACKKDVTISQIHFDVETLAAAVRKAFHSAFALYSTHSHKRATYNNALKEPRFRIVIPLSEPIPIDQFLELWHWAVDSLTEIPADPQVKDPNRIYYTPVKFSDAAPYDYHIEDGPPLDWRAVVSSPEPGQGGGSVQPVEPAARVPGTVRVRDLHTQIEGTLIEKVSGFLKVQWDKGSHPSLIAADQVRILSAVQPAKADIFDSHEARHEELGRRIMARGKRNSRGNYDARCLAHGGKGSTAVLYNPRTGAVACNRGCEYRSLLIAEGLPDYNLPAAAAVTATDGPTEERYETPQQGSHASAPVMAARLHVINALLLAHCFDLSSRDEVQARKVWGDPFSETIEWPGTDRSLPIKVCSFPTMPQQLEAAKRLAQEFDLDGVPGFFRVRDLPGQQGAERRTACADYSPWRINLPARMREGALLAPYDNGSGFIVGIQIHRSVRDRAPFLLSSRGLPSGAPAVRRQEEAA